MLIDVLRYYLQGTSHLITEYFLPTLTEQWEVPSVPASSNRNWYTNQAAVLRKDIKHALPFKENGMECLSEKKRKPQC